MFECQDSAKQNKELDLCIGNNVYVPCKLEGWIAGSVLNITHPTVVIRTSNGKEITVPWKDIEMRTDMQDLVNIADLTKLSPLSVPKVLDCLHRRFNAGEVYTKAGSTLIAVNPFKQVQSLYGENIILQIHSQLTESDGEKVVMPHVYEVAEKAYRRVQSAVDKKHQSIIVSGESGSGKTVSARHLMKYLVFVSTADTSQQEQGLKTPCRFRNKGQLIESRILATNTILEAFGNAATTRNHNSSRFGKYVELYFDGSHHIVGASIKTYLLEKCRVVHQATKEYNFHVFYQVLCACEPAVKELCGDVINGEMMTTFNITNCTGRSQEQDKQNYFELEAALKGIGLTSEQINEIILLLVSIMLLCNLGFVPDEDGGVESCYLDEDHMDMTDKVAELLGLSSSKLETTFTHRKITATHTRRKSVYHKPCSLAEATNRRDCMAKLLYDRLFEWIVNFINSHIRCSLDTENLDKIGILDIYGFESFATNGLEQLCINYANEKLQQHFVTHFLRELQEEYIREAIPWEASDFVDNRMCIQLIEGKPGIIALLDEECSLNRPVDNIALSDRLVSSLQGSNRHIHKATKDLHNPGFMVLHYAEPVEYNTEGLLEKNKDDVPLEIVELLQQCENMFVGSLLTDIIPEQNGKKKKTVLGKFKQSLDNLMVTLENTEPHYIRCIKPNTRCKAEVFDGKYVLSQLLACGVVETVSINKQAFPAKITYPEFLRHFSLILRRSDQGDKNKNCIENNNDASYEPLDILYSKQLDLTPRKSHSVRKNQRRRAGLSSGDHNRKLCATIMNAVFKSENTKNTYTQFGKTQLFLKDGQLERLESARLQCLSDNAFTIQCAWQRYKVRQRKKMRKNVCCLQAVIRGWLQRKEVKAQQLAATVIQKAYKRYSDEKKPPPRTESIDNESSHTKQNQSVHNDLFKFNTKVCSDLSLKADVKYGHAFQSSGENQNRSIHNDLLNTKLCSDLALKADVKCVHAGQDHYCNCGSQMYSCDCPSEDISCGNYQSCGEKCYPGKMAEGFVKTFSDEGKRLGIVPDGISSKMSGSKMNGTGSMGRGISDVACDKNKASGWSMQSVMTRLCQRDVVILSAVVAVVLVLGK